jgi:hypothetical protein
MTIRSLGPPAASLVAWSDNGIAEIPSDPDDIRVGDTLVLPCVISGAGSVPPADPGDWDVLCPYQSSGASASHGLIVYTKVAEADDIGADLTVTFGSSIPWAMRVIVIEGAVTFDSPVNSVNDTNSASAITLPVVNRPVDGRAIDLAGLRYNSGTLGSATPGGTVSEVSDHASGLSTPRRGLWIGERATVSNTNTAAATITPDVAVRRSIRTLAYTPAVLTDLIVTGGTLGFTEDTLHTGWVVPAGADVRAVLSTSSDLTSPTYSSVETADSDGWVGCDFTGLTPGTVYHIGLEVEGVLQEDQRLVAKTLPDPAGSSDGVIWLGSCQLTGSNHDSLAQAAISGADYGIHMGDTNYEDPDDVAEWKVGIETSFASENMKALLAASPVAVGLDNHDSPGGNGSNGSNAAWPGVAAAMRVISGSGQFPDSEALYRSWPHGAKVKVLMTDHWSQRTAVGATDNGSKTLFGATQKQWWKDTLLDAVETDGVALILWASTWPTTDTSTRWGAYNTEVTELENWLDANPEVKSRLLMVGGDSHDIRATSGTRTGAAGGGTAFVGVPSLNASPFDQTSATSNKDGWDIGQIDIDSGRGVFSLLTLEDVSEGVTVTWEAVRDDGVVLLDWSHTFESPEVDGGLLETGHFAELVDGVLVPIHAKELVGGELQPLTPKIIPEA